MSGIVCQGCVNNFKFQIQMSNFVITDFRHTELYLISYSLLREVDGGSIGGVWEQA